MGPINKVFKSVPPQMHFRPSIVGYILFNIGLYLFHLPSNWIYITVLILFSLFCILHHIFDPDFIHFEKWILLLMTVYMNIFLYLYLFNLDIMYVRLVKYFPNLQFDPKMLIYYIVFIQICLLSSILIIFISDRLYSKQVEKTKLYLI